MSLGKVCDLLKEEIDGNFEAIGAAPQMSIACMIIVIGSTPTLRPLV